MAHVDLTVVFEEHGWGDIPDGVMDMMQSIPFWMPNEEDMNPGDGQRAVYDRVMKGHCMTCDGELGEHTMITVASGGIVMIYCGGACYTDMQVLGWLEEQYGDMVEKIRFRGGDQADQPE